MSAAFGPGTGTIHYDNVACTGTEDAITTCVYDDNTNDCSHAEDAGVTCTLNCEISLTLAKVSFKLPCINEMISGPQWCVMMVS